MSEFDGLSAVVTGGGSGIGLATARLLAERGARVAVLDREAGAVESPIAGVAVDVTDKARVQARMAGYLDAVPDYSAGGTEDGLPVVWELP